MGIQRTFPEHGKMTINGREIVVIFCRAEMELTISAHCCIPEFFKAGGVFVARLIPLCGFSSIALPNK